MVLEKINYKKFIVPIAIGLVIWLLSPIKPDSLSLAAWHMFAIFVASIAALITKPLPIGAVALIGFTLTVLTGTLPMSTAITGFGNASIWLIALAFFLSRGIIKTGLGRRIALLFVEKFGKKTLGLAYSIMGVDLILAPATPSNTARAGGIVFPIVQSISKSLGSDPEDHTEGKVGSFLTFCAYQANVVTSAMFLTAEAGNPIAYAFALKAGIHMSWLLWFVGALVPGIVALLLAPLVIYKLYPPQVKETPNAKEWARKELKAQGPITVAEKIMLGDFILALLLWVAGSFIGMDATTVGFIAITILLLTGVLNWKDILNESGAWNTFFWFSVLVMMAGQLNELGFIPWLSSSIGQYLHGIPWFAVLAIVAVAYFYIHYLFASETAHTTALYSAALALTLTGGVPPMLAALMLGYFGNILGSTTHYASGPAPILFGSGYVKQNDWWRLSFVTGLMYIIIFLSVGTLWMKVIGIW
ncbi:MAG: anion permease [Streptococcaceae bacterium]|jgi:DASS family divalent anion:Na+ symporter|nr:anion permease [Streptococcaceae bacterium]